MEKEKKRIWGVIISRKENLDHGKMLVMLTWLRYQDKQSMSITHKRNTIAYGKKPVIKPRNTLIYLYKNKNKKYTHIYDLCMYVC